MSQDYQEPPQEQQPSAMPAGPSYEEIMAARSISFEDIKAHLTGPVISVCLHIVGLALLMTFVVAAPEARQEIAVEIKELEVKDIEKLPDPPPEERMDQPDTAIEVEGPSTNATSQSVDIGATTADVSVGFSDAPDVPMSNVLAIAPSNSPLVLPGIMAGRSKGGRVAALRKFGGSSSTERSVGKGLNWLRDHQNADGSWGEDAGKAPALTALATLAFLAHGETPSSQEYGTCVLKAIRKLIEYGNGANKDGLIAAHGNGYGHAMVAYALSESFALTKIPMIEDAMNKTIGRVVTGQNVMGSYNYAYNNGPSKENDGGPRCDLSVAGWNYQALKAAFAAGCTVKGLETAIENGKTLGLKKTHYNAASGGFSYSGTSKGGGGPSPTMTPVGTLCLQLYGEGKSKEAQAGLKWIETSSGGKLMKCDWQPGGGTLYQWYYQTQALFQGYSGNGGNWDAWNKEFQRSLIKEQESDGHWATPAGKYGVKKEAEWGFKGIDEPIYATSLCCLMLEVYYRYLPTFKVTVGVEAAADGAAAKKEAKDELKIE
ncbi:MAG: prenyltransferase/squalene oxidase repeat-containing protein [Victivallales bacterium]